MLGADALRPRSHLAALDEGTYVSGRRYSGGGGATGWHALAPGFHQLPGPQSGGAVGWHALAPGFHQLPGPQSGGGGATGWQALAPGFHQLPAPQSGGWAEATPDDTAAT